MNAKYVKHKSIISYTIDFCNQHNCGPSLKCMLLKFHLEFLANSIF